MRMVYNATTCYASIILTFVLAMLNDWNIIRGVEDVYLWLGLYLIALSLIQVIGVAKKQRMVIVLFFKHIVTVVTCLITTLICTTTNEMGTMPMLICLISNSIVIVVSIVLLRIEYRMNCKQST